MYRRGETVLRAVEVDDLAVIRPWQSDPRVWELALGRRFPTTEAGERAWLTGLEQGPFPTQVVWAVATVDGSCIGLARLFDIHWIHRTATFGIWIGPDHWGQGHATRATELTCEYGTRVLSLRQIRLQVIAGHDAARAVYLKSGFVDEGMLRGAVLIDGSPTDLVQMVLQEPTTSATSG